MKIIAAYPCLGKTTIYNLNKDKCFDREFNESRSTLGMNDADKKQFFDCCAEIIKLQYLTGYHDVLFISENDMLINSLVKKLPDVKSDLIMVFPNVFDFKVQEDYIRRVQERRGIAWYERVIEPYIFSTFKNCVHNRIRAYQNDGFDVRLTDTEHPYIEDVINLPEGFSLPEKKSNGTNINAEDVLAGDCREANAILERLRQEKSISETEYAKIVNIIEMQDKWSEIMFQIRHVVSTTHRPHFDWQVDKYEVINLIQNTLGIRL